MTERLYTIKTLGGRNSKNRKTIIKRMNELNGFDLGTTINKYKKAYGVISADEMYELLRNEYNDDIENQRKKKTVIKNEINKSIFNQFSNLYDNVVKLENDKKTERKTKLKILNKAFKSNFKNVVSKDLNKIAYKNYLKYFRLLPTTSINDNKFKINEYEYNFTASPYQNAYSYINSKYGKEFLDLDISTTTNEKILKDIYNKLVSHKNNKNYIRIHIRTTNATVSTRLSQSIISFDEFLELIKKLSQSDSNNELGDLTFIVQTRTLPEGGSSLNIPLFLKKRGIYIIENDDDLCGQRCLALAECKSNDDIKNLRKPARFNQWTKKAVEIGKSIEVTGRMAFTDFDKWADIHSKQVNILSDMFQEIYKTETEYIDRIYLYYDAKQEHYHYINDVNSATNDMERNRKWCFNCNKSFLKVSFQGHKCKETVCSLCKTDFKTLTERENHFKSKHWIQCEECFVKCPTQCCFDKHSSKCEGKMKKCNECKKYIKDKHYEEHKCGEIFCKSCETYHFDKNHRCCIKPLTDSYIIINGKRHYAHWVPGKNIWAYDFESKFMENNIHQVNLVVCKKLYSDSKELIFKTIEEFVEFVLKQKNTTFVAHNGKAYDTWLVHKHLIANTNKRPNKLILAGNKIMYMKVKSIRFIDSINHIAQSLATFPETFGLTEMKKGFFPYLFNTTENENYIGKIPDMKYFSPELMDNTKVNKTSKMTKRQEFMKWYPEQTGVYDFQKELLDYCISDVDILKRSLEIYVNVAIDCDGLNPLQCSTIASDCLRVYRTNYMPENKIGILTKEEYDFCKRGFFGGRTEVFKLHKQYTMKDIENGIYGKYQDIQSLYPTVQFFDELPCGIPKWDNNPVYDNVLEYLNSHFGYIECDVECPKSLIIPVLPEKKDAKLMFDLCNKPKSVYTSIELIKALEVGYKITKIYKSLYFEKSTDLFKDYIRNFLKIKTQCNGYNGDDIDDYIERYKNRCGVVLDKYKIEKNNGMKLLAKIRLNSLWGKFGQKDDMPTTEYLSPDRWFRLLKQYQDGKVELKNETLIDENTLYVQYIEKDSHNSSLLTTNVALAGFVTSQARLRLYEQLYKLGDRVIYCDTDSCIYEHDPNKYNIPEGDLLGEWESETNSPIIEVLALAPKSYGYKCLNGKSDLKCKGITLNYANNQKYTFDSLKQLIYGEINEIETSKMEFIKDKKKGEIRTQYDVKKVISFDKNLFKRNINIDFSTTAKN
jgi:hypothetical protein